MNAKIIEGLKAINEGINLILSQCDEKINNIEVKETATEETGKPVTRDELNGMTYNSLKKLAKEMGISAVGNREEITSRILGEPVEVVPEEPAEEDEVEDEVEEVDPVYAKVLESVEGMSTEDIADILVSVGLSAKGKRESLIDKLVSAVKDGLIEFDDEEDSTDSSDDDKSQDNVVPFTKETELAEEEDEEDDDINDVDNPNMTEARKKALYAKDEELRKKVSKGSIKRKDMVSYLQAFYDTEESLDDIDDDSLLDTYIDAVCRFIDDDGDFVEEGAYMLNGEPACCGRPLTYAEDTNMFICEHCGSEYEADED